MVILEVPGSEVEVIHDSALWQAYMTATHRMMQHIPEEEVWTDEFLSLTTWEERYGYVINLFNGLCRVVEVTNVVGGSREERDSVRELRRRIDHERT